MAELKLKKKNYLGEGHVHYFKNDLTGEIKAVPCTKEEYKKMGEKGGSKFNPTLKGHTWQLSAEGTIAVDNPDSILGIGEYVEVNGEIVARVDDADPMKQFKKVKSEKLAEVDLKIKDSENKTKDLDIDAKDLKDYGDSI